MPDKPIIFSAPMIRALLAGRKTQTRRVVKIKDQLADHTFTGDLVDHYGNGRLGMVIEGSTLVQPIPYAPGDRLYVREACRAVEHEDGTDAVEYLADGACTRIANTMQSADQWGALYHYGKKGPDRAHREGQKVPPIHMPRWASRLTLTVTDVRVQRVQEISEADAKAEGLDWVAPTYGINGLPESWNGDPCESFRALWNSIHGPEAWDQNPWVAAYSFDVHRCNIDQMDT